MYSKIPQELKDARQWLCWKYVTDASSDPDKPAKPKKVPIDPKNGMYGKSTDPGSWSDFRRALFAKERFDLDGLGIAFGNGISGIDIDDCVYDGELLPFASEIVEAMQSYAEFSPSGNGIHILFRGRIPGGRRKVRVGNSVLEMYETGRFFTVTGQAYCDADGVPYPFRIATEEAAQIHQQYMAQPVEEQTRLKTNRTSSSVDLADDEILKIAFKSRDGQKFEDLYNGRWENYGIGDGSQSSADQAFCNALAFWFGCDADRMDAVFRRSGLYRKKWDEKRGRQTYGEKTIDRAIQDCREVFQPRSRQDDIEVTGLPEPPPIPQTVRAPLPVPASEDASEPPDNSTKFYSFDDTGNAERFCDMYRKDIRYNPNSGVWMCWDGKRWAEDQDGEIKRKADQMLIRMQQSIWEVSKNGGEAREGLQKHVNRSRSSRAKEAFIKESKHRQGIPVMPWELDRYKNILNVDNAVIDLKTGKASPHKREYMLSMLAGVAYDPNAECPTWIRFLDDITNHNGELSLFLQRMVGYCLTGSTAEQCAFFLYGMGKNGKSTFLDTISQMMSDYAKTTNPETLLMRDKGNSMGVQSELARMKAARMITTFELNEGCRLNEGLIKQLTGGDEVTARELYAKAFQYRPEFKVVMATNHKPIIRGTDPGIWRRVKLVPFSVEIPEEKRDLDLPRKLLTELPGILNWAIEGAVGWFREGLPQCQAVTTAVQEYRREMDRIQQFIEECVRQADKSTVQASVLYEVYKAWAAEQGDRFPLGSTKFGMEVKKRFESRRLSMYVEYCDIELTEKGCQLKLRTLA